MGSSSQSPAAQREESEELALRLELRAAILKLNVVPQSEAAKTVSDLPIVKGRYHWRSADPPIASDPGHDELQSALAYLRTMSTEPIDGTSASAAPSSATAKPSRETLNGLVLLLSHADDAICAQAAAALAHAATGGATDGAMPAAQLALAMQKLQSLLDSGDADVQLALQHMSYKYLR